jgi:hypothetical protein
VHCDQWFSHLLHRGGQSISLCFQLVQRAVDQLMLLTCPRYGLCEAPRISFRQATYLDMMVYTGNDDTNSHEEADD